MKYLHNPWEAPEKLLAETGVRLGKDYPPTDRQTQRFPRTRLGSLFWTPLVSK